jgi:hypothetical protein
MRRSLTLGRRTVPPHGKTPHARNTGEAHALNNRQRPGHGIPAGLNDAQRDAYADVVFGHAGPIRTMLDGLTEIGQRRRLHTEFNLAVAVRRVILFHSFVVLLRSLFWIGNASCGLFVALRDTRIFCLELL